jgi:uncharacterized protein YeaC (DUF1315 family)
MDFQQLLESITPEIYESFKKAVELGKWPDTRPLTEDQKSLCMQAIIAYEQGKPEDQRTGYVPPKATPCDSTPVEDQPLKWQN